MVVLVNFDEDEPSDDDVFASARRVLQTEGAEEIAENELNPNFNNNFSRALSCYP